jgi:hypothetical protein
MFINRRISIFVPEHVNEEEKFMCSMMHARCPQRLSQELSGIPGGLGRSAPPNSEVLTKLSRIPSSVENTS